MSIESQEPAIESTKLVDTAGVNLAAISATGALKVDGSAVTQPVSAASLPLPTGAATAANQTTEITSLAAIDAGIPAALGQTTMAASMPVVIASNQSAIPVTFTTASSANVLKTGLLVTTAVTANQVILTYTVTAGKTLFLCYLDMGGYETNQPGNANPIDLGTVSLEAPSGTKVISTEEFHPFSPYTFAFGTAIPIAAGTVVRVVVTPTITTSITWRANFGGYEQ
jgi:hypothetical protein